MSTPHQEATRSPHSHALQETAPLPEYGDFLDEPDGAGGTVAGLSVAAETTAPSSGEVALWRAVLEQAFHDACRPRAKATSNTWAAGAGRRRETARAAARVWLKGAERDFSLVCDFADLPAKAVQDHAFEVLGTPAERRSRTLRQVVWRAPEKVGPRLGGRTFAVISMR